MQLTVRDVTRFLNVPESTVTRWIKERGLPARCVAGRYRFNRTELLEWATAQRVPFSLEVFQHLAPETEPPPSLLDALEAGGIFYQLRDSSKEEALRAVIEVLPLPDAVDRELLLQLFLAREASASTAVGDGIAIPHVRNPLVLQVPEPLITLCFLDRPVEFGSLDGKPVHVLFSLISPTVRSHIQLLSRLSFALHDPKFKDVVTRRAPREEILAEARRVEAILGSPASPPGKAAS
jgi:PTS system nitrogen regulatory IIA component